MRKRKGSVDPKVLREVEEHLRTHPDYPDFRNQLGLLRTNEGKLEEAETHLQEALRLNPSYREALLNLACLYIESERWHEAEGLLHSRSKRYPQEGFYQHLLGVLYANLGKPGEAAARMQRAVLLQPFYRGYYRKLGLWQGGTVTIQERALAILKKVPSLHLEAHFHNFIGLHLAREGRYGQAVRELQRAAELEPNASLFHMNLGFLNYLRGRYREAIEGFRKGLRIDPDNGMGYAYLGYTYGAMGRLRRALQCLEEAVQLNPEYADLHYNLALLYSGQKRYDGAIGELKKALRINPNYLFARINLGVLYEDLRKWGAARREYRKVLQLTPEDEHVRRRLERIS